MASDVQMRALRDAKGRDVDRLFLAMMKEHHRGGVEMASVAAHQANDAQVKSLATVIARNQRVEINELDRPASVWVCEARTNFFGLSIRGFRVRVPGGAREGQPGGAAGLSEKV